MASNNQGFASSFKAEMWQGIHNLGVSVVRASTAPDVIKAALYYQNSSLGPGTTVYTITGEVSGTGYTAGGIVVSNAVAPQLNTNNPAGAYWTPSASLQWTGLTITSPFDCYLLYNASQGNRALAVLTFTPQTIAAANLTISMPANTGAGALFQVS